MPGLMRSTSLPHHLTTCVFTHAPVVRAPASARRAGNGTLGCTSTQRPTCARGLLPWFLITGLSTGFFDNRFDYRCASSWAGALLSARTHQGMPAPACARAGRLRCLAGRVAAAAWGRPLTKPPGATLQCPCTSSSLHLRPPLSTVRSGALTKRWVALRRGFGGSDGEPRHIASPAMQLADWESAMKYAQVRGRVGGGKGWGVVCMRPDEGEGFGFR